MASIRTAPSYLLKHPSGYIFRYCIPQDLKNIVNKTELRYSLRSGSLTVAKRRARLMAGCVQMIMTNIRKGGEVSELTSEQINHLLNKYLKGTLDADEESRIFQNGPLGEELYKASLSDYDFMEDQLINDLTHCDDTFVSDIADKWILEANGIEADKNSFEYKKLCRELLKIHIQIARIQRNREKGDYSDKIEYLPTRKSRLPTASSGYQTEDQPTHLLSEVMSQYFAESEKAGNWTLKTKSEIQAILYLFIKVKGNLPIQSVDRSMMSDYKQILMKLPPNMNKVRKYKDRSIHEILNMKVDKTLSTSTINKHLVKLSTFFIFAVRNGFIDSNPAEGMQIPTGKRDDELRDIWEIDDLKNLFSSKEYLSDTLEHSYAFWTPLLGLFTGCRLEEICQLHLEDIRKEDGIWIIDVNGKNEKKVKSKAARREIPIHPFLLGELNFDGYVDALKKKGETRLFPELTQMRDGYGQRVSKWFARFKVRCGISDDKKTFHSLRHTFITALKHKRVVVMLT